MNNVQKFISLLSANIAECTIPSSQIAKATRARKISALLTPDNQRVLDIREDSEMISQVMEKLTGTKTVIIGLLVGDRVQVTPLMSQFMAQTGVTIGDLLSSDPITRIMSFAPQAEPSRTVPEHVSNEDLGQLLGSIFNFSGADMENPCAGCDGCRGDDFDGVEVDWDQPVFNQLGAVTYKRKEGDQEKGYRMVKFDYEGMTIKYPVDTVTGAPLMPGMDEDIYAVDNEPLDGEDDTDEELAHQEQGLSDVTEQLIGLFPQNEQAIRAFANSMRNR